MTAIDADGADPQATFRLERFHWAAPDRLVLAGRFDGAQVRPSTVTLMLRGPDGPHRLGSADADRHAAVPEGEPWEAEFVWSEAPAAFDVAELHLGDGRLVALPAPGPDAGDGPPLDVRRGDAGPGDAPPDAPHAEEPGGAGVAAPAAAAAPAGDAPAASIAALKLQAALLAAEDEARDARLALHQAREELSRVRADLEADRIRHAEDARWFRESLEKVRDVGEQALTEAQLELADLRERLGALEGAQEEAARLREALVGAAAEAAGARDELAAAREEAGEAQALRARLAAVREALES